MHGSDPGFERLYPRRARTFLFGAGSTGKALVKFQAILKALTRSAFIDADHAG